MAREPPFGESAFVQSIVVGVTHPTDVAEARRKVVALAQELGFDETDTGRVAVVVSELAMNLVRHGGGGELMGRAVNDGPAGVEVLALDTGPGMADFQTCMRDGFSTGGTQGAGLGAVWRMSEEHDVFTAPGMGTVLVARLFPARRPRSRRYSLGVTCVAKPGEDVCGDAWSFRETEHGGLLTVADGLGHGPLAADAARAGLASLASHASRPPLPDLPILLDDAHRALRATRGAAMSLSRLNGDGKVHFLGVGNVLGAILHNGQTKGMVPRNGTLGVAMRPAAPFQYEWPLDGLLVMHSDGLASQWRLDKYPGLTTCDPAVIAGVLYRDFRRGSDDVTVSVLREARPR